MTTDSTVTATMIDPVRTKQLQELWSKSFDAWINVPHHDEPVVYLRPQQQPSQDDTNAILCTVPPRLPAIVHNDNLTMFAITGYNPMGEDQPMAMNIAANEKLRLDLEKLDQPRPRYVWSAFGFSKEWREDGFVIAYHQVDRIAGEAAMVALAVHYRQGAIFGFDVIHETTTTFADNGDKKTNEDDDATSTMTKATPATTTIIIPIERLLRRTIPAAMTNVEADMVVVPCAKPEMANADYHHPLPTVEEWH